MIIKPAKLKGVVNIPPSKSVSHRAIICAALAEGESVVDNLILSEDFIATINGLRALGADITTEGSGDRYKAVVRGGLGNPSDTDIQIDCHESGSTLRFLIPIAAALGSRCSFVGRGRLGDRPLDSYYEIFATQKFSYTTADNKLPLQLNGQLRAGNFVMRGDVSSQFITGLLFALPILSGDSRIEITTALESKGYIDLTLQVLQEFGIKVVHDGYQHFYIRGGQKYQPHSYTVEGDYSQAAFWLVAGCLGHEVVCQGLNRNSLQADRAILEIIQNMNGNIVWSDEQTVQATSTGTLGRVVDVADCPDIAPILTVLAALSTGKTELVNAARLRIKESDRILSITTELNKLGAHVTEGSEEIVVQGVLGLECSELDAWNDHRIAMALAIACTRGRGASSLQGAESVKKSYPHFWEDYRAVGGCAEEELL